MWREETTSSVPQQRLPVWRSTPSCWLGSPSQKNWGLLTMINGIGKIRLRWIRKMGRWRAWFIWIGSEEDWEQFTVTNFISPYFNLSLLYWTYLMLAPLSRSPESQLAAFNSQFCPQLTCATSRNSQSGSGPSAGKYSAPVFPPLSFLLLFCFLLSHRSLKLAGPLAQFLELFSTCPQYWGISFCFTAFFFFFHLSLLVGG